MKLRVAGLLLLVPLVLLVLGADRAMAGTVFLPLIISESIEITEGDAGPMRTVRYTVENPGGNGLEEGVPGSTEFNAIAFAVETFFDSGFQDQTFSTSQTPSVPPGDGETYGTARTTRDTWNATILTEELWNGVTDAPNDGFRFGFNPDYEFDEGYNPDTDPFPSDYPYPYSTDQFGTWQDNFGGIMAAQVAFYFDNEGTQQSLAPGDVDSGFTWSHPLAIPRTVTFSVGIDPNDLTKPPVGASGSVIPLPSAAWMGLGLMGILAAVRRRRRAR